jgi:hypothetical protein
MVTLSLIAHDINSLDTYIKKTKNYLSPKINEWKIYSAIVSGDETIVWQPFIIVFTVKIQHQFDLTDVEIHNICYQMKHDIR